MNSSLTPVMGFPELMNLRSRSADTKPCLNQVGTKVWWVSEASDLTAGE
ncbi:hypothetical protein LG324_17030 [Phycicoccus jejuensis]